MFPKSVLERNRVRIVGKGDHTIVFAHGFGTDQNAWASQVDCLKTRYCCVLLDHVGSGRSDLTAYNPRRYASLYPYASDLLQICGALQVRGATMVGHSVSGMISLIASVLDPGTFSRIAVIGASPRYLNDPADGYHGGFDQPELDSLFASMSANYHAWATGFAPLIMGNSDQPELARYYADSLSAMRPDIAQSVLRVIFASDHRQELRRVAAPVCIMQARNDMAVPDSVADYLGAQIPNGAVVRLNAEGHLPHLSSPRETNAALQSWLCR